VLVLIAGLQDADKIGHAGSIPVFGHSRNLTIGRGLALLPKPHEEIGDVFHGVLSAANCGDRHRLLELQRGTIRRKAGGHYAADLILQLPAREILLTDRNGETRECIGEAFRTPHQILVLVRDERPKLTLVALPGEVGF
jgi:hypothetical protein